MSIKDVLTLVAAFLAPTIAAAVALVSNLGRRQRLKLAVEIRSAVDENQLSEWNRMIRRDTAAVIASSQRRWVGWTLYFIGTAIGLSPALLAPLARHRIPIQLTGLVVIALSLFLILRSTLGRRKETRKESVEIAKIKDEIAEQEAEKDVLKSRIEHLKERGSVGLEFASRTAYDFGAPMKVVRQIRLLDEDFKFAHLLVDRDSVRWKARRVRRGFSVARYKFGTVGQEIPDELRQLLERQSS